MAKSLEKSNSRASRLGRKTKETIAELKKVSWPNFKTVVKQTGIVLVVVIFFTLVLFGIDSGLGALHELVIKQI